MNVWQQYQKRMRGKGSKNGKEWSLSSQSNPCVYLFRCWAPSAFKHDTDKLPIIAFGNGMKGKDAAKIKGQQVGITGVLYDKLKQRQKEGRLLVTYIDEFNTLKVRFA